MFLPNVLDAKIVDNQTESDGTGLMGEETRGALGLVVAGGFQVLDEAVACKDSGLGQSVHALADFYNYVAIMDEWGKMVLCHDTFWNVFNGNVHVFRSFHGSA
eukprot:scaffold36718_cov30-Attheya_sp.AAC.2